MPGSRVRPREERKKKGWMRGKLLLLMLVPVMTPTRPPKLQPP
jgi:hypothetical protein